nr:hypothetical protein [Tanacetum cinerariifolium]
KVLSMQENESEAQEAVEVVTTAKLITKVIDAVTPPIEVPALVKAVVPSTRRKRGVVIKDLKEESSIKTPTETTFKDKGKAESIKQHLQIVLDEDDDVSTEATPLARKIILLVERRYPLIKFTLEHVLNVVRLQVEEDSEMSLELIKFTRQQLQEAHHN